MWWWVFLVTQHILSSMSNKDISSPGHLVYLDSSSSLNWCWENLCHWDSFLLLGRDFDPAYNFSVNYDPYLSPNELLIGNCLLSIRRENRKKIKKNNTLVPKQIVNIRKGFKEFCHWMSLPWLVVFLDCSFG